MIFCKAGSISRLSHSWGFWPPCRCASESFLFRNQRDLQRVLQKLALWLCYSSKRTQEDLDHFQIGLSIPCRYFLQAEEQASPALDNDSFSSQAALLFSFSSVDSKELKLFNVCCRVVISRIQVYGHTAVIRKVSLTIDHLNSFHLFSKKASSLFRFNREPACDWPREGLWQRTGSRASRVLGFERLNQ